MSIKEKLKIILSISKLTQQELADKLKVSFQTLNSWINQRSNPRKKQIKKIDDFYLEITGQNIIPDSIINAKKIFITNKSKNIKILDIILNNKNIYEHFVLNITYHTNNIEGSTLTKIETRNILFDNNFKSDKSIQETLEAKNHQTAFNYLLKHISERKIINEDLVLRIHSILMSGILPNAGLYRNHSVRIIGTNIPTANHLSINKLMNKLFLLINKKNNDIISNISKIHAEFEKIHPFSDGNGRIGRLLLIGQLLNNNLPPAIIKKEHKHYYYTYLAKAQSSDDLSLLENFICDAIMFGMEALNIK